MPFRRVRQIALQGTAIRAKDGLMTQNDTGLGSCQAPRLLARNRMREMAAMPKAERLRIKTFFQHWNYDSVARTDLNLRVFEAMVSNDTATVARLSHAKRLLRRQGFELSSSPRPPRARVRRGPRRATRLNEVDVFETNSIQVGILMNRHQRTQNAACNFSQTAHVEPAMSALTLVSPVLSAFSFLPSSSGLVAAFLKDCSKSAMMSSMCSVPTDILIRSYERSQHDCRRHMKCQKAHIGNTTADLLLITQLLVRGRPRVNRKRLRITNVCQV